LAFIIQIHHDARSSECQSHCVTAVTAERGGSAPLTKQNKTKKQKKPAIDMS